MKARRVLRKCTLHVAVMSALAGMALSTAAEETAVWTGGEGTWGGATNWLPMFVPGATTDVFIDGGKTGIDSVVSITSGANAGTLTIDEGDQVRILNAVNNRLTIHGGNVNNDGTITLNSTGSTVQFRINGDTTLSGSGVLTMSDVGSNHIVGFSDSDVLTQSAGHTIDGSGRLGNDSMSLINHGLVDANSSTGLVVNLTENGNLNTGTMRASNGGTLTFNSTVLDNTGGLIQAQDGSVVRIATARTRITGGTLDTEGSGVIELGGSSATTPTLASVANTGLIRISSGRDARFTGNVENDGTIEIVNQPGSTRTRLMVDEFAAFTGTGSITLAGNSGDQIRGRSSDALLVNEAAHTIQGSGNLGVNLLTLDNRGLVDANNAAIPLIVNLNPSFNSGVMRASNGGTLRLNNTAIDNTDGTIAALDGSLFNIDNSSQVRGGTLMTEGSGVIELSVNGRINELTNLGRVEIRDRSVGFMAGTITNDGTIALLGEESGGVTDLRYDGDAMLAGDGKVIMTSDFRNRVARVSFTDILFHGPNHTIEGGGQIVASLVNRGLIDGSEDVALTINPGNIIAVDTPSGANVLNTGTLRGSGAGGLLLANTGNYLNQGVIEALNGSNVTFTVNTPSTTTTLNNQAGTLEGGVWRAVSTGDGATVSIMGTPVATNSAVIELSGEGSVFQTRVDLSATNFVSLEESLTRIDEDGVLRLLNDRDYSNVNDLTNAGLLQLGGGTLDAPTLTNSGTLSGHGTVIPRTVNSGEIEATGGTLTMVNGIQAGSGTVLTKTDGGLDLSQASQSSSAQFLTHQGTATDNLNLGANDFIVSGDYTNDSFGVGNAFDHRANVVGSGLLVGENAAMAITGDVTAAGGDAWTLDLGNVRGGTTATAAFQIVNSGTGSDIRGALQTEAGGASITDSRLTGTGVTADNFGPIAAGEASGNLSVTFAATSGGAITEQTLVAVSNFDNVAAQGIEVTGMATALAQGSAAPAPIDLGAFRVGLDGPSQGIDVENNTTGPGAERLGIGSATTSGNFEVANNLGSGLIDGGATAADALTASVSGGTAGLNTAALDIQYTTDGTLIDSAFTAINANSQNIGLSATGYQVAEGQLNTPSLNFGTVQVGQSVEQALSISNSAEGLTGFVEDLNASFGASSGAGAGQILGIGSITGLMAGDTDGSSMVVSVNTGSAGSIDGAIGINYFSAGTVSGASNGLGILGIGSDSFGVSGTIQMDGTVIDAASPVINTPQPIQLGNVRQASASPTAFVSVTNEASGNDKAALNAEIAGNAPITASGSFDLLTPGTTDRSSLQVGMNTSTAGAIDGTATISFVSDASNVGGCKPNCQMDLPSQDVQVQGAVYRLASPEINTPTIVLAARVGDALSGQNIGITNQSPDAFTEGLKAGIASVDPGFSATGEITNLAAGASDNTSLGVALTSTTESVSMTGTVSVEFHSTGEGTTGEADFALPGGALNVEGRVYQKAVADVRTPTVDFGIVHVGETVAARTVRVSNAAEAAALNDLLQGDWAADSAGVFSSQGDLGSGLGAGTVDDTSLRVGLDTSEAGIFSETGLLKFQSTNPELDDLFLAAREVNFLTQVNNFANPIFTLDSGPADLLVDGLNFALDFGTLFADIGGLSVDLSFLNDVEGPADLLRGAFNLSGVTQFTLDGFSDFDNLGAGEGIFDLNIAFNTIDLGIGLLQESVLFEGWGFNASGFEQRFDLTLDIRARIRDRDAASVNEPPTVMLLLAGLLGILGVMRRRIPAGQPQSCSDACAISACRAPSTERKYVAAGRP